MGHLDRRRYPHNYAEQAPTPESLGIVENIQSIARILKRRVDATERQRGKQMTKEQVNREFRKLVLEEATYKSADTADYWAKLIDFHGRKDYEIDMLLKGRYQILEDATRLSLAKSLKTESLGLDNPGY